MKLIKIFKKLCQTFGGCDEPEIIEDMNLGKRTSDELSDIFHTQLGFISEGCGLCYFDAFVEHMMGSGINVDSRAEVEMYLYRNGLKPEDIEKLTNKFYEGPANNG